MDRVLVVDDIPEVRLELREALEGLEIEVLEARDGIEAFATVVSENVSVVVSDVRMPRLDGVELLKKLEANRVPVILHSGYADVRAAVEALRLGAVDFLPAPIDHERLRSRVTDCLRGSDSNTDEIVGTSREVFEVRQLVGRVARERAPVLITGETGVGKEVVARAIHRASSRSASRFVAVNVCALNEGTLESELFGHEEGSFTGAKRRHAGRFEVANGGTILLDEIGDASPIVQAKLLRVVETGAFERLGGTESLGVDVRVLAATHRDLPAEIAGGRFRQDLWYRLGALRIHIPPLRRRVEDIEVLARSELSRLSAERGGLRFEISNDGISRLKEHDWPGNVRELNLTLQRMVILAGERRLLGPTDLERALEVQSPAMGPRESFVATERSKIIETLGFNRWNVSAAARELGISRGALRNRMDRLGISSGRDKS